MLPFNPFSALTSKIFGALAALFFVGFVTQTIRIEGCWLVVGFKEENAVLRLNLSKIKDAQVQAEADAKAARERDQLIFTNLAERADHAEQQIASLRSAADRYARTHRVRTQAADRPSGAAGPTGQGSAAPGSDGPGGDAVVLAKPDYDTLIGNTERLLRVHNWGDSLIDAGLAEKAGE